jgi:hypothetical protein
LDFGHVINKQLTLLVAAAENQKQRRSRASSEKIMEFGEYQRGNSISKDILPNAEAVLNPYT